MFSSNTSQVASSSANYVEDVFATYLYTGTGASQTITNNIDTTTYGGLVWIKGRSGATGHRFTDTARGTTKSLESNSTAAEVTESTGLTAFGTTGFTIGADADYNTNAATYTSWTFRKQAKFFDVVTYTGTGANRTIAHNLGSVPGCIIIKRTDTISNWSVYHTSLGNTQYMYLNSTAAATTGTTFWNSTTPTSTNFSLGISTAVNNNGGTYVAYLFAHDAGGFGLSGTDNVISCGTYYAVQGGSDVSVNLGYEPQFVLMKNIDAADDWRMYDVMRGMQVNTGNAMLRAQSTAAEFLNTQAQCYATSTGFVWAASTGLGYTGNVIYIAIRRGPMKVPTSGTSVFTPAIGNNVTASGQIAYTASFPVDMIIGDQRSSGLNRVLDRLRGGGNASSGAVGPWLRTTSTAAESASFALGFDSNAGTPFYDIGDFTGYIGWMFRRAPSFMDVVCWYGDPATVNHNLTVVPELIIQKNRTTTQGWSAWRPGINYGFLNTTAAFTTYTSGTVTSTTFTPLQTGSGTSNYVAYLFASTAGVSKVGSYTGTGTTKQIDCGFTGGARFVLIKRTDSTGDWYVWDSARGIVASTDPYLTLNTTAAEVTTTDWVDTYSAGFELSSNAGNNVNINGASYIFLSVA